MIKLSTQEKLFEVSKSMQFRMQYPRFILAKAVELLDKEILQRIHALMNQKGYSDKIIKNTKLVNVNLLLEKGEITYEIISDFKAHTGFDVAKARERGSPKMRFWIAPVKKKATMWMIAGVKFFSKGHWGKGIEKSFIIRDTMAYAEPLVQAKLDAETSKLFRQIMGREL